MLINPLFCLLSVQRRHMNAWKRKKKTKYLDFSSWVKPGQTTMFPANTLLPWRKTAKVGDNFNCGKWRVTIDGKLAYNKCVNIFFQINAWIDIDVCKKWIKTMAQDLARLLKTKNLKHFFFYLINLPAKNRMSIGESFYNQRIMLVWLKRGDRYVATNVGCFQEISWYLAKGLVR